MRCHVLLIAAPCLDSCHRSRASACIFGCRARSAGHHSVRQTPIRRSSKQYHGKMHGKGMVGGSRYGLHRKGWGAQGGVNLTLLGPMMVPVQWRIQTSSPSSMP